MDRLFWYKSNDIKEEIIIQTVGAGIFDGNKKQVDFFFYFFCDFFDFLQKKSLF